MSFPRIFKHALIHIFKPKHIILLIIISLFLFPAFTYDNSVLNKSTQDNYYLGSACPSSSILINNTECFLLIGSQPILLPVTRIVFNITTSFISENLSRAIPSQILGKLTLNYFTRSDSNGRVFINLTELSLLVKKQYHTDFFRPSNLSITITQYTVNRFSIINGTEQQKDYFFNFENVIIQSYGKNYTVFYYTLPSCQLGYYGNTLIFYAKKMSNQGYNISSSNPNYKILGELQPLNNTMYQNSIHENCLFVISRSTLGGSSFLSQFNSGGINSIFVNGKEVSVNGSQRIFNLNNYPRYGNFISGASVIAVSGMFVFISFYWVYSSYSRRYYLGSPYGRGSILLSHLLAGELVTGFVTTISFVILDMFAYFDQSSFMNLDSYYFILFTTLLTFLSISSLYMVTAAWKGKSKKVILDVLAIAVLPLVSISLSLLVYSIYVSKISHFGNIQTMSILYSPLSNLVSLYNEIKSLIPIFSPWEMNKLLLQSPFLGVKMYGDYGLLGINTFFVIVGSFVLPILFTIFGAMRYRNNYTGS